MRAIMAARARRVAHLILALTATAGTVTAPLLSAQSATVPRAFLAVEGRLPVLGEQTIRLSPAIFETGGTVDVEIVVDVDGSVAHARVAASSDASGVLGRACLAAMTGWRLKPATGAFGDPQATLSLARFTFKASPPTGETGSVSVRLMALTQLPPPTLQEGQFAGLADTGVAGYRSARPLRNIMPRYTEDAMRAKVQGTVTVELAVLADGTVGAARIRNSLHESLDRAALIAARYWYFEPATIDGRPVASKAMLALAFNLR